MKWISHRGNINGPNPLKENTMDYIYEAIKKGYQVEIDVWRINKKWFLGHDKPEQEINDNFLFNENLWCHAKNLHALQLLLKKEIVCFWHQNDDYTITSNGFIWAYPGLKLSENTICVMPEIHDKNKQSVFECAGICSDYIEKYKGRS